MKIFAFLKTVSLVLVVSVLFAGCGGLKKAPPPSEDFDVLLKEGIRNVADVKSADYIFSFEGDLSADPAVVGMDELLDFVVTADFEGAYDFRDTDDMLFSLAMALGFEADDEEESFAGEVRFVDSTLYFILSEVSDFGGELPVEMVEQFVDQWWSIYVPADFTEGVSEFLEESDLEEKTPEQKQLDELFEETDFFTDVEYLGTENIRGVSCYKYSATLDKEATLDYAIKVGEITGNLPSQEDIEEARDALDKIDMDGLFWIGANDEIFRKFSGSLAIDNLEGLSLNLSLNLEGFNLNEAVSVPAPADSSEFDLMMLLGGGGF